MSEMRWGTWLGMTLVVILILLYEWPRLRDKPRKDKVAFCTILFIGWVLSLFDLPRLPGPITALDILFKPLSQWMGP